MKEVFEFLNPQCEVSDEETENSPRYYGELFFLLMCIEYLVFEILANITDRSFLTFFPEAY